MHFYDVGFAFQWIASVAKATTVFYSEKIMHIPRLTHFGAAQLSVDIGTSSFPPPFSLLLPCLLL